MSTANTVAKPNLKWRVVDIAVASVIGVASALIYWGVAIVTYGPWEAMDILVPGLPGLFNGLWLFAGPLAAIIVRKPGAAIYAEVVAGVLEALMGNMWGGAETFLIALVQGVLAEIAFLVFAYRKWNLPVTILSGALSGLGCWAYSFFTHLQAIDLGGSYGVMYLVTTVISGVVFAGVLMWFLYVAIAKTGALDKFASGREVRNA
ncbi:ECF transporter S component [Bifidobacterium avesanii]|uniref:ABC transporter permease n=1 Tax=Bifidobacterium avesanii TaxID=1798157 RepID=A0A7K3TEW3_9BIFI|nr:ECF transporter S component [Bifidobacterium avesanii]KAB8295568.1 ABC transporter permease [Bifidobacterium avesanii]NEG77572.1 ABC transporter permease [Bifidobacterium avesanii]